MTIEISDFPIKKLPFSYLVWGFSSQPYLMKPEAILHLGDGAGGEKLVFLSRAGDIPHGSDIFHLVITDVLPT